MITSFPEAKNFIPAIFLSISVIYSLSYSVTSSMDRIYTSKGIKGLRTIEWAGKLLFAGPFTFIQMKTLKSLSNTKSITIFYSSFIYGLDQVALGHHFQPDSSTVSDGTLHVMSFPLYTILVNNKKSNQQIKYKIF